MTPAMIEHANAQLEAIKELEWFLGRLREYHNVAYEGLALPPDADIGLLRFPKNNSQHINVAVYDAICKACETGIATCELTLRNLGVKMGD